MNTAPDPAASARRIAAGLARDGARAIALVGSRATGTAASDSDLDLAVVGDGPLPPLISRRLLVSLGWASADEQRRRLYDPAYLGTHVTGWRSAVILHDPEGLAAAIKREALDWLWPQVEAACDSWVAETLTGYAEEVARLRRCLRTGNWTAAAVLRSMLAVRRAPIMAVHLRLLYGSENDLWRLVSKELCPAWAEAQRAALNVGEDSLETSCRAALDLFALAAAEVQPLLDERQRAVVDLSAA